MNFVSKGEREAKRRLTMILASVAGLGIGLVWYWTLGPGDFSRGLSLCQDEDPQVSGEAIIIIDASDTWSALRRREVENEVLDRVRVQWNVSLYAVQPGISAATAIEPLTKLCNPGSYDSLVAEYGVGDVGARIAGNRTQVDSIYRVFKDSILGIIDSVAAEPSSNTSPIMETLRWAAVNATGGSSNPLDVFLVSDLLQNSSEYSFYRESPDLTDEQAASLAGLDGLGTTSLEDARVFLYILLNPPPNEISGDEILAFWRQYLANQGQGGVFPGRGAEIERVKRVP